MAFNFLSRASIAFIWSLLLSKLLAVPGILVNERDSYGWTPIMDAITYGKSETLRPVRVMAAVEDVDLDVSRNGRSLEDLARGWAKYVQGWFDCSYKCDVGSLGLGNISRLLQLEPRLAGEAASGKIVGILEKARQRREKRKRLEPSFAVFKYCSKNPFSITIYIVVAIFPCSGWWESRRTEWARCSSPSWEFSKYHFVKNLPTCTYYCATLFLNFNFQGSLGGDLRWGQHVAQAEGSQMCGGGRDANRVGTSHLGLAGWTQFSISWLSSPYCNF